MMCCMVLLWELHELARGSATMSRVKAKNTGIRAKGWNSWTKIILEDAPRFRRLSERK